jgi:hypothetical protein
MLTVAIALSCLLIAESFVRLAVVMALARKFEREAPVPVDDSSLPKAGVILSLRGADPGLRDCLLGLLDQDYPQYSVEIVVDSESDSAWQLAHEVIRETRSNHVRISALASRSRTCSLKCSSLIQAVGSLDQSHTVLAFCDADVVPHRTWLRELAAPLTDPGVGATTGNRWYAGPRRYWGSLARSAWNSAAIAHMSMLGIPWGGSLAIRRQTFDDAGSIDKWAQSFNDDLVLGEGVRSLGLKLRVVPSLVMVERGETPFDGVRSFVFRQLMHLRFYHRSWRRAATCGCFTSVLGPAAALTVACGLSERHWPAVIWSAVSLAFYIMMMAVSYRIVESAVTTALRGHGRIVNPLGLRALWAAPLAICMFGAALAPALIRRTVSWRGAMYRIRAPWSVELLSDQPPAAAYVTVPTRTPIVPSRRTV